MADFILREARGAISIITLNRPEVLNAWHAAMRADLVAALDAAEADAAIRAIVMTGAGERAFGAGQDLNETKTFDPDRAELWVGEWERLYDRIRSLSKPLVMALNGVAAGSAFQVALLGDFRIAHAGVTMGQPEINSGIASTTGPWIMREMIGLARTIDLTLSGRMMDAAEAERIGLINR
ncbi:MAG: enoyl-CoA hydratase/isomerase family protein, partial [Acetobacteraceae bacterium]|nr:enoyl-CoA hydratase/isomerase family protein [Acetobacteraceae bacterium]